MVLTKETIFIPRKWNSTTLVILEKSQMKNEIIK